MELEAIRKISNCLKSKFIQGVRKGLIYYTIATITTFLTYTIFGWGYRHAPSAHHFVALLFLLGSAILTLYYFLLLFAENNVMENLGILTVHVIAILSFVLYLYIML